MKILINIFKYLTDENYDYSKKKVLPTIEEIKFETLIFVEKYGNHKIYKNNEFFYIKKHRHKSNRMNRSKLVLNSDRTIKKFKKIENARNWINRRWNEKNNY